MVRPTDSVNHNVKANREMIVAHGRTVRTPQASCPVPPVPGFASCSGHDPRAKRLPPLRCRRRRWLMGAMTNRKRPTPSTLPPLPHFSAEWARRAGLGRLRKECARGFGLGRFPGRGTRPQVRVWVAIYRVLPRLLGVTSSPSERTSLRARLRLSSRRRG